MPATMYRTRRDWHRLYRVLVSDRRTRPLANVVRDAAHLTDTRRRPDETVGIDLPLEHAAYVNRAEAAADRARAAV